MGFDNVIAIAGAAHGRFTRNNRFTHFYPDYYLGQQTHFNTYGTLSTLIYCGQQFSLIQQEKWSHMKTDLQPFFITTQVSLQAFLTYLFSPSYASALSFNEFDYEI